MINSMTGYGKSERLWNGSTMSIEIRSLNNRFLDLIFKAPRMFNFKEAEVKELVKKYIERGKVSVNINIQSDAFALTGVKIDPSLVRQYVDMLRTIAEHAKIEEPVRLEHLLNFSEIFSANGQDEQYEPLWKEVMIGIEEALKELNILRDKEGAALLNDLLGRLQFVSGYINRIEQTSQSAVKEEFVKLQERVAKLVERTDMDPQRMQQEIAILSDKVDITEEIVRFRSHCRLFEELLNSSETKIGRKLIFVIQEMGREVNTMGSKSPQSEVIHTVVAIKEELEKLREQLQNVE
jgi:uncharacterized protein (TIGR00255 family)